ncbi:MAG: hypothetical protein L6Q71_12495 [Planctomycetes bacterium]|nr:hypothetical protein [Planctomycetota bacterium]NUQ34699.1 hypothetical protein [Planctomycetaceae bacterium]
MKISITIILFFLAAPLVGQADNTTKQYDVSAGQLKPSDVAAANKGKVKRTQTDVDEMVRSIAAGYRSVCCPHKSLVGSDTCASYEPQMAMIEFLAIKGYGREEIEKFMVHGGPPELADDYKSWLKQRLRARGKSAEDFEIAKYFTMPHDANKDYAGLGYLRGWGENLHEAPRNVWLYFVIGLAAVAVLMAYSMAAGVMKRDKGAPPAGDAGSSAALDERIRKDMEKLDEA